LIRPIEEKTFLIFLLFLTAADGDVYSSLWHISQLYHMRREFVSFFLLAFSSKIILHASTKVWLNSPLQRIAFYFWLFEVKLGMHCH
jgi:hypothetical protein